MSVQGGLCVEGSLSRGVSVGVFVQGSLSRGVCIQGGLGPEGSLSREGVPVSSHPYGNVRAVRILLECILVCQYVDTVTFHKQIK